MHHWPADTDDPIHDTLSIQGSVNLCRALFLKPAGRAVILLTPDTVLKFGACRWQERLE